MPLPFPANQEHRDAIVSLALLSSPMSRSQRTLSDLGVAFASARCLVLGGGGFIGTNLSNALAAFGAHVHAYGRRLASPGSLVPSVRWTTADLLDQTSLTAAVEAADFIFHLASSSTPASANADPVADVAHNLITTLHFLEICRTRPVRRIVFVSSGGTIYGATSQNPIPETATTDPISAYAIHKLTVEKYFALYRHLYGLDYLILRVANPYGPVQIARKNQGVVAALMKRALAGDPIEIWGSGEVVRDFIYIDDVVRALLMATIHPGPSRLFNVGSGAGVSINTVIGDVERVAGRGPLRRVYMPSRAVDVPVNVLDISRIRDEIGWTPEIEWLDGLRRTMNWMRDSEARPE
jgi:UDP-glucose 4-epimerase